VCEIERTTVTGVDRQSPGQHLVSERGRVRSLDERRGRTLLHRLWGVHAERVIERVVEKVTPTGLVNYPILSKTNYEWSLLMNIKMEARSLWNTVVKGGAEFHVDRMALNVIWCAVTVDMITTLAVKPTAKEAWDYIKTMRRCKRFGGSTSCSHSRKGRPWRISPFGLTPSPHNQLPLGMLSRTTRLPTSIFTLRALRYKQHVISIDTLLDSSDLSMEDIIGRLRAAEDDGDTAFVKEGEKLYLTEDTTRNPLIRDGFLVTFIGNVTT
jgi:hypothetical protein